MIYGVDTTASCVPNDQLKAYLGWAAMMLSMFPNFLHVTV
jgi:hypothetical protein